MGVVVAVPLLPPELGPAWSTSTVSSRPRARNAATPDEVSDVPGAPSAFVRRSRS